MAPVGILVYILLKLFTENLYFLWWQDILMYTLTVSSNMSCIRMQCWISSKLCHCKSLVSYICWTREAWAHICQTYKTCECIPYLIESFALKIQVNSRRKCAPKIKTVIKTHISWKRHTVASWHIWQSSLQHFAEYIRQYITNRQLRKWLRGEFGCRTPTKQGAMPSINFCPNEPGILGKLSLNDEVYC